MMVRSAAKEVSNTAATPIRFSAAVRCSSITGTVGDLLRAAARVAGTAGAIWATTTVSGSASAATTSST